MVNIILISLIFFINGCNREPKPIENKTLIKIEQKKNKFNQIKIESLYFKKSEFNIDSEKFLIIITNANIIKKILQNFNKVVNIISYINNNLIDEYSYSLALKQAFTVKKLLISSGVPENKIFMKSLGSLSNNFNNSKLNYSSKIEFKILELNNKK